MPVLFVLQKSFVIFHVRFILSLLCLLLCLILSCNCLFLPDYKKKFYSIIIAKCLVNIIVIVGYFYLRLRIRYPELILVVIIGVSEAGYMTIHSISRTKSSEWVGIFDTASSSEPEGRVFATRLVFFFFSKYFLHAIV